jgi:hypothetical protein
MRELIKRIVGERNIGRIQCLLMPSIGDKLGGPMNGQEYRRRMCSEIMATCPPRAIVETGTFRGSTTAYFGAFGPPVYSVEFNARHAGFAEQRLARRFPHVHLFVNNSPDFLRELANDSSFPKQRVFFYLDAHWYRNLPLAEELTIIFSHWTEAVVMVDDFQVPGTDYAFDDYGPGHALTMGYLAPLASFGLTPFFPAVDPAGETGLKRGCVVLCREAPIVAALERVATLRRLEPARI